MGRRVGTSSRAPASVFGRAVKLSPSHRRYGLGAIMLVTLTSCSRTFSSRGAPSFLVPLAVAGVAYLLAIREFLSTQILPKRVVVIGLVLPRYGMFCSYGCRRVRMMTFTDIFGMAACNGSAI